MKRIEISKPTKWWWVKRMDIYVAIILVFLPLYISMEYQDLGKSIFQSVTSGLIWVAPISLYLSCFI
jgi:hypothetical protein